VTGARDSDAAVPAPQDSRKSCFFIENERRRLRKIEESISSARGAHLAQLDRALACRLPACLLQR